MGIGKVAAVLGMIVFSWVVFVAAIYVLLNYAAPLASSVALKGR